MVLTPFGSLSISKGENSMKKAAIWLLCISALISTAAFGADVDHMNAAEVMAISDKNHDGRLDREEYDQRMTEVFFLIDTNKDGRLTLAEIRAAAEVEPVRFKASDMSGDQTLSLHEYLYALDNDFDAADRNKDGTLDMEELRLLVGK
jgi:Ca2+-binding EF-hand superfamily protein